MNITISRKSFPNRWEAVATAKAWTIADGIGQMPAATVMRFARCAAA